MKKLALAFASVCAIGLSAVAADNWFNGGIETGWPNAASMTGGEWANTNGSSYADQKVTVSADASAPLTFEATNEKAVSNNSVTVTSTLTFTPFSTLPDVPETAKAGVIAYKVNETTTNFYVVAKDANGDNVWTDSGITAKQTAVVKVTFSDGDNATYDFDNVSTNVTIKPIETIKKVCLSGDGAIAALSATTEAKATGPQTPGTGGGSVAKAEGEENVYVVTPDPTSGNVTIVDGTLKGTDIIRIVITNDMTVTGVPANQIEVVFEGTVVSNSVFVGGSPFSTELNENGSAAIGSETIQVKPQLSGTDEEIKPFVLDDNAAVGVKTIPGLRYTLVRQAEVGGEGTDIVSKRATEARTELEDTNKPADKAFYIIRVTK